MQGELVVVAVAGSDREIPSTTGRILTLRKGDCAIRLEPEAPIAVRQIIPWETVIVRSLVRQLQRVTHFVGGAVGSVYAHAIGGGVILQNTGEVNSRKRCGVASAECLDAQEHVVARGGAAEDEVAIGRNV